MTRLPAYTAGASTASRRRLRRLTPLRSYRDEDGPQRGLDLQLGVLRSWLAAGEQVGGWKIGITTRTARDSMGDGFRPFGYVLASRIRQDGAVLAAGEVTPNAGVEIEIGLTIGRRLAGEDVTPEQAHAAVASVHPSFELVTRRLPSRVGVPIRLGNSLGNWGSCSAMPRTRPYRWTPWTSPSTETANRSTTAAPARTSWTARTTPWREWRR